MIGKQRTMYGIITLYLLSVGRLIHSLSVELPYNILWQEGNEQSKGGGDVQGVERGGMGTCVLGFGYSDYGFIFCSLMCLHFLFSPFVGWSVGLSVCRSVSLITIKIPANAHRSMDRTGEDRNVPDSSS